MKKICTLLLMVTFLCSCTSTPVQIDAPIIMSDIDAVKIIERVFFEQSIKFRPENVVVTHDYIALAEGRESRSRGSVVALPAGETIIGIGNNRTFTRDISTRIYFDSIGEILLYKKRDYFIIQIQDNGGRVIKNVYCRVEDLSNQFIGSIYHFSN